ncbi:MAG TPA: TIGR04282 family arsenosugar biosynthesis glycosyltransferase [Daejeonella sp.]|nr:TIGR04282 family arsenosugar biosynthesis glycosyltransferase [Daejeonella sp.]
MKALIIFTKNPQLGKVKTRLAKDIGDRNALVIYQHLLKHTLQISVDLQVNRLLYYDQQIDHQDQWPEKYFQKAIQQGEDLGERMLNAFQNAFQQGYQQVVIIGSDCPDLSTALIESAFHQLQNHDFVLGPATDGGYYLLGMKYPERTLFQNKVWSTHTVAEQTLADIHRLQKTCSLLPELSDVDQITDLNPELRSLYSNDIDL